MSSGNHISVVRRTRSSDSSATSYSSASSLSRGSDYLQTRLASHERSTSAGSLFDDEFVRLPVPDKRTQVLEFWKQEVQAESRFLRAEMLRDAAEEWRGAILSAEIQSQGKKFARLQRSYRHRFSVAESGDARETLRVDQCLADERQRSRVFKKELRWERQKHLVAQLSEDERIKSERERMESLENTHRRMVEEVRRRQSTGAEPSDVISSPDRTTNQTIRTDPRWDITFSDSDTSEGGSVINRRRRRRSVSVGRRSPEFRNGRAPLNAQTGPKIEPDFSLHHGFKMSFKRAQAERQKLFARNTKKRRAIFDTKEMQRALKFYEAQTARINGNRQAQADRMEAFRHSQLERDERFRESQERRESNFCRQELYRQNEFFAEQKKRDKQFDASLRELLQESLALDHRRKLDFDAWYTERLGYLYKLK